MPAWNGAQTGAAGMFTDPATACSRDGATETPGEYLHIPLLLSEAKTPPVADCDEASELGRVVLKQAKKKGTLWACLSPGVWAKL